MAVLLFYLRGVPDDEAEEVRKLLSSNGLDYYETSAGNWGLSTPAIWLKDDGELHRARALIDEYQAGRARAHRERSALLRDRGEHRTVMDVIREHPVRVVASLVAISVVLYFSIGPFLRIGGP